MKYRVECCHAQDTAEGIPSYDIVEDDGCPVEGTTVCGENLNLTEAKQMARMLIASLRKCIEFNLKHVNSTRAR